MAYFFVNTWAVTAAAQGFGDEMGEELPSSWADAKVDAAAAIGACSTHAYQIGDAVAGFLGLGQWEGIAKRVQGIVNGLGELVTAYETGDEQTTTAIQRDAQILLAQNRFDEASEKGFGS